MIKLIIPGRLHGANDYINAERRNKYAGAKLRKETEQRIELAAKAKLRGVRFDRPVIMHYHWLEANRKRGKDNIAFAKKFVQDALVSAGVLKNDGWEQISGFSDDFDVDKDNPRVEIEFEEV